MKVMVLILRQDYSVIAGEWATAADIAMLTRSALFTLIPVACLCVNSGIFKRMFIFLENQVFTLYIFFTCNI